MKVSLSLNDFDNRPGIIFSRSRSRQKDMVVAVLDQFYLGITVLVTLGWQLGFFLIACSTKSDIVTDFAYGTNFVALALLTFLLNGSYAARNCLILAFVTLWGLRLALYLFARVRSNGNRDHRFDETRDNIPKFALFWLFQLIVVWTISIPFTLMSSVDVDVALGWRDALGIALFVIGFLMETVADAQKFKFKNKPENKSVMYMGGVWRSSRHPNYFGEMLVWWGIFSMTTSVFENSNLYLYFGIVGPLLVTIILLFFSGIPTLEPGWNARYGNDENYRLYRLRVPPLIPFVPCAYECCPDTTKCLFCCEFPMYARGLPETSTLSPRHAEMV